LAKWPLRPDLAPRQWWRDRWWSSVFLGSARFSVYANWAAFQKYYTLRTLHFAVLFARAFRQRFPARTVRPQAIVVPGFLPFSPALLILWIPGLFRLTCYYYRGAYYKSFWADPPACAVSEPRKSYLGERSFPLIMQNFHRYFLRLSYIVWGFLVYDAWKVVLVPDTSASASGSIVLS
jgi:hypothetical protein